MYSRASALCGSLSIFFFFFLMIRRPPRSTLFPSRRSSDLGGPPGRAGGRPARGGDAAPRPHDPAHPRALGGAGGDRKSTRLNSSHLVISYAVFCLKKKHHLVERSPLSDPSVEHCSRLPHEH